MRLSLLCGAFLLALTALAAAEPPDGGVKTIQPSPNAPVPPPEPTPVIPLAVKPRAPEARALRYTLLPDPLDLTPGNAAPLWIRAGDAAQAPNRKLVEGPYKGRGGPAGTALNLDGKFVPLKDLPKEEIRSYLANFAAALRLADQAARCDHCDWEFPPLRIQDFDLPLDDVQRLRMIAGLLGARYRLELSEGRLDDALHTLQTGFALARDVGKGDTLIQDLVAIAVGAIMFGHLEEWEQTPGSPNLFWALTDLPAPLVNTSHAMRTEMTTLYRSFPALRKVLRGADQGALSEEETDQVAGELFKDFGAITGETVPDWQRKLGVAAIALKTYPDAKKYLLAHGRTAEQVEGMSSLQVVLLYFVEQYDQAKDDLLKWMNVAPWQARPGLEQVTKRIRDAGPGNPIIGQLVPAIAKCYEARLRIEYIADYHRCAEALRLYATTHDGKPPAVLEDVKLPLPLDPYTGEGFDKYYKVEADGTGVFAVPPPPPNLTPSLGRRFELIPPK